MGVLLAMLLYSAYLLFLGRIVWRIFLLAKIPGVTELPGPVRKKTGLLTLAKTFADIVFLSRLFKSNPCLWLWEWLFHATFVFVMLRHLRYVMDPPPSWLVSFQTFGTCSGFILPAALLIIFVFKLTAESVRYVSTYNFFILSLLLLISLSGILMRTISRVDVTSVKYFVLGALTFSPVTVPEGGIFLIHYLASLVLLVFIPSHIFTAPWSLMEARRRDDALRMVLHGK